MADAKKKETKRPQATETRAVKPKTVTLAERPILRHAVEGFIRENSTCEASFPINTALEEMSQCDDLMAIFTTALRRQLFGMDAALRWLLFLSLAPGRAVSDSSAGEEAFASPLSTTGALNLISTVYDIGVQTSVWEHFEEDEDDEDDEDDEGEEQSGGEGSK
jgi:hypothetical protein